MRGLVMPAVVLLSAGIADSRYRAQAHTSAVLMREQPFPPKVKIDLALK